MGKGVLIGVVLAVSASSLGGQATRFANVDRLIRDEMARNNLMGFAVTVSRGDTILWEAGFGLANREKQVRTTAHTPFYMASVTKAMVATAVMILHQRGLLNLDRPANHYLGNSALWSQVWDARLATVRQLVTHTAGLSTFDVGCGSNRTDCGDSIDEMIDKYGVLVWPAGEHFDYSNLGYRILAEIVARRDGRNLDRFLRDELFGPLGMNHSSLGVDSARLAETAVSYSWTRGPLVLQPGSSSSSSIYASAHDLALFGMMHARVRGPDPALLSSAAIDTMHHPVVATDGTGNYGFGWTVENERFGYRSLLAQGGTDAAQAWLRIIPAERIVVAVVANQGVGLTETVVDAVLDELLPRYAELRAASAPAATGAPSAPAAVVAVDSMFTGAWSGTVRGEAGEVTLSVDISADGVARTAVGVGADERTGRARMGRRLFVITVPGGLDTRDSTSGRQLAMYLKPRNGVLNGVLTTSPPLNSGLVGRVSYWVELRRR